MPHIDERTIQANDPRIAQANTQSSVLAQEALRRGASPEQVESLLRGRQLNDIPAVGQDNPFNLPTRQSLLDPNFANQVISNLPAVEQRRPGIPESAFGLTAAGLGLPAPQDPRTFAERGGLFGLGREAGQAVAGDIGAVGEAIVGGVSENVLPAVSSILTGDPAGLAGTGQEAPAAAAPQQDIDKIIAKGKFNEDKFNPLLTPQAQADLSGLNIDIPFGDIEEVSNKHVPGLLDKFKDSFDLATVAGVLGIAATGGIGAVPALLMALAAGSSEKGAQGRRAVRAQSAAETKKIKLENVQADTKVKLASLQPTAAETVKSQKARVDLAIAEQNFNRKEATPTGFHTGPNAKFIQNVFLDEATKKLDPEVQAGFKVHTDIISKDAAFAGALAKSNGVKMPIHIQNAIGQMQFFNNNRELIDESDRSLGARNTAEKAVETWVNRNRGRHTAILQQLGINVSQR